MEVVPRVGAVIDPSLLDAPRRTHGYVHRGLLAGLKLAGVLAVGIVAIPVFIASALIASVAVVATLVARAIRPFAR